MRWKAALPFLAPIGTTFHCMGPSGVDIAVQGCNGSTNVEDTLIYFVPKFIVDYAFLFQYGLLNGPRNSRTENARWQPRIATIVRKI